MKEQDSSGSYLFTSESVAEGHPDKMADQIADGVLDAMLEQDCRARVACEVLLTTGTAMVAGEITTTAYVEIPALVRETIMDIGYDNSTLGFDGKTCGVLVALGRQSPDIAQGVDGTGLFQEQGAGDQGLMFGYASRDTDRIAQDVLMPMPIFLAHRLTEKLTQVRKSGRLPWLRPDGKSQGTVEYRDDKPHRVKAVVIAAQHDPDIDYKSLCEQIRVAVIQEAIPADLLDSGTEYLITTTGRFVVGGPVGDCGVTGRKIIMDTYGGFGHHGGGAFSGKDPSKVDRSSSYMCRYVAKNLVAAGLAERCEIQVAYTIGRARPVSVAVTGYGAGLPDAELKRKVEKCFDLRPAAIIERLDLLRPIFRKTCNYGHFGRLQPEFTWERLDAVDDLLKA